MEFFLRRDVDPCSHPSVPNYQENQAVFISVDVCCSCTLDLVCWVNDSGVHSRWRTQICLVSLGGDWAPHPIRIGLNNIHNPTSPWAHNLICPTLLISIFAKHKTDGKNRTYVCTTLCHCQCRKCVRLRSSHMHGCMKTVYTFGKLVQFPYRGVRVKASTSCI